MQFIQFIFHVHLGTTLDRQSIKIEMPAAQSNYRTHEYLCTPLEAAKGRSLARRQARYQDVIRNLSASVYRPLGAVLPRSQTTKISGWIIQSPKVIDRSRVHAVRTDLPDNPRADVSPVSCSTSQCEMVACLFGELWMAGTTRYGIGARVSVSIQESPFMRTTYPMVGGSSSSHHSIVSSSSLCISHGSTISNLR